MRKRPLRALAPLCLALLLSARVPDALAGGVGISSPPDVVPDSASAAALPTSGGFSETPFHLYKPRQDRSPHAYRDYEFLWSDTYKSFLHTPLDSLSGTGQGRINDLQRLAETAAEAEVNALGLPMSNIRIVYNMLAAQTGYRDATYHVDPQDSVGFRVAQSGTEYAGVEGAHIDAYVYARSFGAYQQWQSGYGGEGTANTIGNAGVTPSDFVSPAEDSSSGHAAEPRQNNSLCIAGPFPSQVGDTSVTRTWTRARGRASGDLLHESEHSLNADATAQGLHFFASAAEVVTGVNSDVPHNDFDYHFSLSPAISSVRIPNAYPHWQSFMAYLAFNWRGADTTAAGWTDDLLRRWATREMSDRLLPGLALRLRDSECAECATYANFAGLDSLARVQRLIHDWRVALYVNNSSLPGGKYGYPPQFGYVPAVQVAAWQNVDGVAKDDSVSVPPVITLGTPGAAPEQWFTERPASADFRARPLKLSMFGAEYFIFRADQALTNNPKKLVVRVRRSLMTMGTRWADYGTCVPFTMWDPPGRLYASVVRYSQAPEGDSLFRHPEWATSVSTKSVVVDSVRADLEFEVPAFGGADKAVLVVVTLEDGPVGYYSGGYHGQLYNYDRVIDAQPFALGVTLADAATPLQEQPVATTSRVEDSPSWSPDGARIAYREVDPQTGLSRIYLRASDGSGVPTALRSATTGQFDPSWSPREDKIAYADGSSTYRHLWLADVATGAAQQLTSSTGAVHESCFLPDGGRIAYLRQHLATVYDSLPRDSIPGAPLVGTPVTTYYWDVRLRDLSTGADSLIAQFVNALEVGPGEVAGLRAGPNGRYVTFSWRESSSGQFQLYQCDLQTRSLTLQDAQAPLARMKEARPGAGPLLVEEDALLPYPFVCETSAIQWCGCEDGVGTQPAHWVALRDTLTSTSTYLSYRTGADFSTPHWSPDGTKVAYTTTQNGNADVYVIAATGDRAPVFASSVQSYYSTNGCLPFELSLAATDPDGDPITYEVLGLPAGALLQSGSNIYWGHPVIGDHWLVARALDTFGAVATRLVHLNVYDAGGLCGGDGGEEPGDIIPLHGNSAGRVAGSDRLIGPGAGTRSVNSFLDGAASGEWVSQTARLVAAVADTAGHVSTRLVALRPGVLKANRARLVVVDHPAGTVAVATEEGIAVGAKRAAMHLATATGEELTGRIGGVLRDAQVLSAGAVLNLEFADADSVAGLVMDCARAGAVEAGQEWGVRVEAPDSAGWRTVGVIHPRSGHDELAVPLEGETRARLMFLSDVEVRDVAGYTLAGTTGEGSSVTTVACAAASTESGVANLALSDSVAVELSRGEGVTMRFDGPPAISGTQRTFFLDLVASFTPESGTSQMSSRETGGALPARFALHANRPNPFGGGTSIRFDVPRTAAVRIEIFDAMGRRVRTLADRAFEPGAHSLAWDGVDGHGHRLSPGVYLYRMTADGFREQRRMVLLGR